MTSVRRGCGRERGRGRGRGWADNDKALTKPGKVYNEEENCKDLITMINLIKNDISLQEIEDIASLFQNAADHNDLEKMHAELYKYALKDKEFGHKLLIIYIDPIIIDIADSKYNTLRKLLVNGFQLNFERREDLQKEDIEQFYANIYLFSEYVSLTVNAQRKLAMFQRALICYMETLLETASARDIEVFAEQITAHGTRVYDIDKERVDSLMNQAKQILVEKDITPTSRLLLLYTVDIHARSFKSLPKNIQEFYNLQLGKKYSFIDCSYGHK